MDCPRMRASRLGLLVLSVTIRLFRGTPSGVADLGVDR